MYFSEIFTTQKKKDHDEAVHQKCRTLQVEISCDIQNQKPFVNLKTTLPSKSYLGGVALISILDTVQKDIVVYESSKVNIGK